MVEGFHFIHRMRLRAQMNPDTPSGRANRLNPYTLNHMDRQMLKQAFKQARRLQSLLEVDSQAPAIVKAKGDFAPFAEDSALVT